MKLNKLTKPQIDEILDFANFNERDEKIFLLKTKGLSDCQISFEMGYSIQNIKRIVAQIKEQISKMGDDTLNIPIHEKVALTIEEAAEYSNIGQTKIRELIKEPKCTFVLFVGKKALIKRKEFEKFVINSFEL